MNNNVYKGIRIPRKLSKRIDRVVKGDGSTFASFIRSAAMKELKRREKEEVA